MKSYFRGGLFKEVTVGMMFLPDKHQIQFFNFQFQLFLIAHFIELNNHCNNNGLLGI